MPTAYILIGVPGSGKSTWVANQDWAKDCSYISTDVFVEEWAQSIGKTYSEVFEEYMPVAVARMAGAVNGAKSVSKDIIWDQTSTTIASRARKFRMLPNYKMIAVVFDTPEQSVLVSRLNSRPGKEIPLSVIEKMMLGFELPTEQEGFDEIWHT